MAAAVEASGGGRRRRQGKKDGRISVRAGRRWPGPLEVVKAMGEAKEARQRVTHGPSCVIPLLDIRAFYLYYYYIPLSKCYHKYRFHSLESIFDPMRLDLTLKPYLHFNNMKKDNYIFSLMDKIIISLYRNILVTFFLKKG